jgi:cell division protein FtsB
MILVSINFRSFIELSEEVDQHSRLASQVQNLTDENLALQEEIHSIKTDPRVIEREARRIGIALKNEKVSVPAN